MAVVIRTLKLNFYGLGWSVDHLSKMFGDLFFYSYTWLLERLNIDLKNTCFDAEVLTCIFESAAPSVAPPPSFSLLKSVGGK